ncbi:YetF domain-containing protein [Sphingopyxis terrae]|uniref:YetF domain-containing protein n=1 Tax=Sphingopyxis terrae TaxID=33052 RepID=UPI003607F443
MHENFRRDRLTEDEIYSEMRLAGIARLEDVAWAILEPQGKISFVKRTPDEDSSRQESGGPAR